ncbi:MAG TPA: EAL domain-containing protein [Vicinamibacteria bacterium]
MARPFDFLRRRDPAGAPVPEPTTSTDDAFEVLAEVAGDAVVRMDEQGRIAYLNPAARRLFAFDQGEVKGRPFTTLFPERLRATQEEALRAALATRGARDVASVSARTRDGREMEVEMHLRAGTRRGAAFVSAVFREAATASSDHFHALAETLTAAVMIYQDDVIRYANHAASVITGYPREELVGACFWELAHADQREMVRQRGQARQAGRPTLPRYEARLLTRQGEERWVDLTATSILYEGRPAGLAAAVDITEARLAEGAMRESDRRMRHILENVQLIALTLDVEGAVTFANEYVLELMGYTEEELVGQDWFELALAPERREVARRAFRAETAAGVVAPHQETPIVTRDGDQRLVSWNNTVLRAVNGDVLGVAALGVDVTERRRVEERLVYDAFHDALTGLPNRALFVDRLGSALARSLRRPNYLIAVLFLDVDRFKTVNDSLGHRAGDQLLIQMSRVLSAVVRPGDTVARMGGDEFTVLLDDIAGTEDATTVAQRIQDALAQPFDLGSHEVFATASIGISLSGTIQQPEELLRNADAAMYQAKAEARGSFQVFDTSMHARAVSLLQTENELRRAVENQAFLLHFQPIVELATGRVSGLEALVRWEHSRRGLVSPLEFIHLAEDTGLIFDIGQFALEDACRAQRGWREELGVDLPVSVNLSAKQFAQKDLLERISGALRVTGVPPHRLKLEITESVLMNNAEAAIITLRRLKELGLHVCIDDFGTGYSSLSYLLRLPADTLKIDRSFVVGLEDETRNAQLVGTIVSLGASLGMEVVAEGVETEGQRGRLAELACPYGQGYHFSRPMDLERTTAYLRARAT